MSRHGFSPAELPGEFALAAACAIRPRSERRVETARRAADRVRWLSSTAPGA
jgi:hypothetical protein